MKSIIEKVNNLFKDRTAAILKITFAVFSAAVVIYAVYLLLDVSGGFLWIISAAFYFFVKIALKFFFLMIISTFPFILPPCLIYLAVCLFVKRKFFRYYIFLLLFSFYIIWFIKFVLHTDFIIAGHILKIPEILAALVQIYIFLLLIMPVCMYTVLASAFFIFKSILVYILPDLPFRFDDFGIILALFLFTFFYLNNIVLFIKKTGNILLKTNLLKVITSISGGRFYEHRKK